MAPRRFSAPIASLLSLLLLFTLLTAACDRGKTAETTPPSTSEVSAPAEVAEAPEVVEAPPEEEPELAHEPLLWQIDGPNGPTYLLGTIHVGFDAEANLPDYVWRRLDASDTFYMETDLGKVELQSAQRASLPDGKTLDKMLPPELWRELDRRLGGAADQFRSVKPWFIVSLLTLKMLPEGIERGKPMDQVLHKYASTKGKTLGYLESPEFQLGVLEETLTIEELEKMLREFDEQKADLAGLLEAYRQGDVATMETLSFKDKDEKPQMYEKLFYMRNAAWVPQIVSQSEKGNTFFAFGAGHLLGERGVLDLLEKQGLKPYRVTREVAKQDAAP